MDLTLYSEFPGLQVQIIPLEGTDFTTAQASGEFQQEKFISAILFGLNYQLLDLLVL